MSSGQAEATAPDTSYYDFLVKTLDVARDLTERLIFMEEPALASNANLVRSQISQMVEQSLSEQVSAIPMPDFAG